MVLPEVLKQALKSTGLVLHKSGDVSFTFCFQETALFIIKVLMCVTRLVQCTCIPSDSCADTFLDGFLRICSLAQDLS